MEKRPVIFLGTPAAAVTVLDAIVRSGHPVPLVVTRADARRGRGGALSPSPVKARALELGLPVTDDLSVLENAELPEHAVGVVVAYGRIVPASILARLEMLNVHFSLLPRWRGAAPVERAIIAGDAVTGVCIMRMEEGLDTGPVYAREEMPIDGSVTATELTRRLAAAGAGLMCSVLSSPLPEPVQQTGEDTYARKITAEETRIDWTEDAALILRRIRAVSMHTVLDGRRLRIPSAVESTVVLVPGELDSGANVGTGRGSIRLVTVQPEGKQPMPAGDWLRGLKTGFPVGFDGRSGQ